MKVTNRDKVNFLLNVNGKTLQDKLAVCKAIIYHLRNDKYVPSDDTIAEVKRCKYHCRKNTNDLNLVLFHEEQFKKLFDVPDGVFIDVGAHIGKHTIYSAVNGAKQVIAVEPSKENYNILLDNVKLNNLTNVTTLNCACWDKNEEIKMYHDDNGNNNVMDPISDTYEVVKAVTLDSITEKLNRVDVIKIDVESAEANVLMGARETIKKFHPRIVFEAFQERELKNIRSILESYGNHVIIPVSSCDYLAY